MIQHGKDCSHSRSEDSFMEQTSLPSLRRIRGRLRSRRTVFIVLLGTLILLSFRYTVWISLTSSLSSDQHASSQQDNITTTTTTTTPRPVVNPYPYHYTILTRPCTDEELLIVVHSAIQYHKRRMAMRDTWLNRARLERQLEKKVRIVFVTGATNDTVVQNYLLYENELYRDILQSDFIDHYQNNTYKALSYIRWATSEQGCPNVSLILKVDDDALLHPVKVPLLNHTISSILQENASDIYAGKLLTRLVNRQRDSKWYMSPESWPDKYYPTWFQGLAYMLTPSLAAKLPEQALYTRYLFTDDVYVGILVSKLPDAKVIPRSNIGASADSPGQLVGEFVNGSHIFYHVPFYECFYAWYARTDVTIRQPPPPKQKTSVGVILLIIFSPFILLFVFCAIAILYFNNCDDYEPPASVHSGRRQRPTTLIKSRP